MEESMEIVEQPTAKETIPKRSWSDLRKVLDRDGLTDKYFEAGEGLNYLAETKILIIGAGGLGCEMLKGLSLMGFTDIHIIDCDTIDLSNLNRQFLFRTKDIGRPKAEVAAEYINKRVPGCHVVAYNSRIEDKQPTFYAQFSIIVCGLDAIEPRQWLNQTVFSLLEVQADGTYQGIIPIVDGGTEGFKGNVRVIVPSYNNPCIECQLSLFPPRVTFPLCTISNRPRLPEHCIEYARVVLWPKERPFGERDVDGDDSAHLQWILDRSIERAKQFNIDGVTFRLTQGVVKHIIPAVASTNAAIASACVTEVFKIATAATRVMKNYMTFSDIRGIASQTIEMDQAPDCVVCSNLTVPLQVKGDLSLAEWLADLADKHGFVNPAINMGSNYVYMPGAGVGMDNLVKSLRELNMNGQEVLVSDAHKRQMFAVFFS